MCSASFSSPNRLPSHSQTSNCNKACCKHYEGVFESNDQLHGHIGNRECTSARKSNIASKSRRTPLAAPEKARPDDRSVVASRVTTTAFNSANKSKAPLKLAATSLPPAEKVTSESLTQARIESGTTIISGFAGRSKVAHKSSTIRLAYAEGPPESPLPAHHAILPSPSTYAKPRDYLVVDDFIIRYAPLRYVEISRQSVILSVVTLSTMSTADLFKGFETVRPSTAKCTHTSPASQSPHPK